jgi:hypothetical protein
MSDEGEEGSAFSAHSVLYATEWLLLPTQRQAKELVLEEHSHRAVIEMYG